MSSDLPVSPSILRIMRIFRMVRILKLLKTAQGVRALLDCVFKSIGQITNMCFLLFIFFVVYAAAGVELFGRIGCTTTPCKGISEHANFSNFGMAILALFRVCTGDNGNGILLDSLRRSPECDDSFGCKTDCCAIWWLSPAYFMSFTVLAQFVLLNVAIAVLMNQLEESQEAQVQGDLDHKQQRIQRTESEEVLPARGDDEAVFEGCETLGNKESQRRKLEKKRSAGALMPSFSGVAEFFSRGARPRVHGSMDDSDTSFVDAMEVEVLGNPSSAPMQQLRAGIDDKVRAVKV